MSLRIYGYYVGKEVLIMDVFLLPPADYFAGQEEAAFDTLDTHRRLWISDFRLRIVARRSRITCVFLKSAISNVESEIRIPHSAIQIGGGLWQR